MHTLELWYDGGILFRGLLLPSLKACVSVKPEERKLGPLKASSLNLLLRLLL